MNKPQYTVVIQWSDDDGAYVVSLPEWGTSCKTHGATYEEAARNAQELLELLIQSHDVANEGAMPSPRLFHYPGADVIDVLQRPSAKAPVTAKSA